MAVLVGMICYSPFNLATKLIDNINLAAALSVYGFLKIITGRYKEYHWSVYMTALFMIYDIVAGH